MRRLIVLAASFLLVSPFIASEADAQGRAAAGWGGRGGVAFQGGGMRAGGFGMSNRAFAGPGFGYRGGVRAAGFGYRGGAYRGAGWGYGNRWYGGGYYGRGAYWRRGYYNNWGWGAGALAAGAVIGAAAAYPYYYGSPYYYGTPGYYGGDYYSGAYYARPYYAAPVYAAPVSSGIGGYCSTPVRTCQLINAGEIGSGCSCRVAGGRARGSVVP